MAPTVSIVVPVFNAEDYIRRCVDSVLNQDYQDYELLLADDGSSDASGTICDEYAKNDSRVRVIHKENTGVSDTRNLAIRQAKGIYIQFLDSDDWITADATKLLVRSAKEYRSDMVIADFYRVSGERVSRKGDIGENRVLTREEFAEYMMENPADFYYGVLWNKLYRRDLIEKYDISMNASISWCEDFMFNLEYMMHAERFYALQAPIYYYVKRKGSLVSKSFSVGQAIRTKRMVFEYYNNFYKNTLAVEEYERKKAQVYKYLFDVAGDGTVLLPVLPGVKRLGEERQGMRIGLAGEDGFFNDTYREHKLLDRYLETVALKYNLLLSEAELLCCLKYLPVEVSRKELADVLWVSVRSISLMLKKLTAKELIGIRESQTKKGEGRKLQIEILKKAEPVMKDIEAAEQDFEQARCAGFDESEQVQYEEFRKRIKENIRNVFKEAFS